MDVAEELAKEIMKRAFDGIGAGPGSSIWHDDLRRLIFCLNV